MNDAVVHAVMVVLVEGIAMGRSQGLDVAAVAQIWRRDGGLVRPLTHRAWSVWRPVTSRAARRSTQPQDSTLALAMAQDAHVPLSATQAAQTVYDLAVGQGLGRSDLAVSASLWEGWCRTSLAYGLEVEE